MSVYVIGSGRLYDPPTLQLEAPGQFVLELDAPGVTTLVVRDGSGAPIPDAVAYGADTATSLLWDATPDVALTHRGPKADGEGRMALLPTAEAESWMVTAPGYAWQTVATSPDLAEIHVTLEPGGDVEVQLTPTSALPAHEVQALRSQKDANWAQSYRVAQHRGMNRHYLEGLAPGTWTIGVGPRSGRELRSAWRTQEVVVRAGERTPCVLQVTEGDLPPMHRLPVLLRVPPAWELKRPAVRLVGASQAVQGMVLEDAYSLRLDDGSWRLLWDRVPEGWWWVRLDTPAFSSLVEVSDDVRARELQVPQPGVLHVEVVDAVTGEHLSSSSAYVTRTSDAPAGIAESFSCGRGLGRGAGAGRLVGVLPCGTLELSVSSPGYATWERAVDLAPESSPLHVVARMGRAGRITVRFQDGDHPALRGEHTVSYSHIDRPERGFSTPASGTGAELEDLEPGMWDVWLERDDETSSAQSAARARRVTVGAGEHVVVELDVGSK